MINKPSMIVHGKLRFLIMDAPARENVEEYAIQLNVLGAKHLVRTCEGNYDGSVFESHGIQIHDLYFQDGTVPSRTKTSQWLKIVRETFLIDSEEETKQCIAVHCLAGLGRAPVLVAIALIEFGMEPSSAISHIRKSRQGALNSQQVGLLMSYRRTGSLSNAACCFIY